MNAIKAEMQTYLSVKMAPTAGDWDVARKKIVIVQTGTTIQLRDGYRHTPDGSRTIKLCVLAEAGQIVEHGEYDNNIYTFKDLDDEQQSWLTKQLGILMKQIGVQVVVSVRPKIC